MSKSIGRGMLLHDDVVLIGPKRKNRGSNKTDCARMAFVKGKLHLAKCIDGEGYVTITSPVCIRPQSIAARKDERDQNRQQDARTHDLTRKR